MIRFILIFIFNIIYLNQCKCLLKYVQGNDIYCVSVLVGATLAFINFCIYLFI